MAKKHRPVDHKDSDAEYADQVQKFIAKRIGAELLPAQAPQAFVGRWRSSVAPNAKRDFDLEHLADGTLPSTLDEPNAKPGKWLLEDETYFQTTWVPPMPEYGIDEESWSQEAYRCAVTADGRIVYWNGDGSYVEVLTRVP
jgi:hypothetical protein